MDSRGIRVQKLYFSHFVVDRQGVIFASARDKNNRIYNFIIDSDSGIVQEQVQLVLAALVELGLAQFARIQCLSIPS